jgi:hypothetical protein
MASFKTEDIQAQYVGIVGLRKILSIGKLYIIINLIII